MWAATKAVVVNKTVFSHEANVSSLVVSDFEIATSVLKTVADRPRRVDAKRWVPSTSWVFDL